MSARQADISDADSHVSVKAKMSKCLDNIRSERAADTIFCVYIDLDKKNVKLVFIKLIRILLLMNISECL